MAGASAPACGKHGGGSGAAPVASAVTKVTCDGMACNGSGGLSRSAFLYRVEPGGAEVSFFDIGVEDADLTHYSRFALPLGWHASILDAPRNHDLSPAGHGTVVGRAGTCPYTLRFSGSAMTSTFELGYGYYHSGFHEVQWDTSERQTAWDAPAGVDSGPVHAPSAPDLNFLVIVLDDVGTDKLGIYDGLYAGMPGAPRATTRTPRLTALAEQGIRFDNFYTNPLCSTSRAALMTGRYAFRNGLGWILERDNSSCENPGFGESCFNLLDEEVLLPELLKTGMPAEHDYRCGAFGKWHLSYWTQDPAPCDEFLPVPDPWTGPEGHAVANGFDRFFGTMGNVRSDPCFNHYNWKKVLHDAGGDPVVDRVTGKWSASDVREDAVAWINEQRRPFFAYVAFNPPHLPIQIPPSELLSPETRSALADCPDCARTNPTLVYNAMLESVDTEIGRLYDEMDPRKRASTMIFVVSDNGTPGDAEQPDGSVLDRYIEAPHNERHGKGTVYQLGVRVPMIVTGPLVPPAPAGGWSSSELVNIVDLWGTIEELSGASRSLAFQSVPEVPCQDAWIDSLSFAPLLRDPAAHGTRPWAFVQQFFTPLNVTSLCQRTFEFQPNCLKNNLRALTDGHYKLIRTMEPRVVTCAESTGGISDEIVYHDELYRMSDVEEDSDLLEGGLLSEDTASAYSSLRSLMDNLSGY